MPTFVHGKSAVFKVDNSGGTLTTISDVCEDVSFPRSIETAETTTFGSTAKSYIVGLTDATISASGKYDATVDAHLAGIVGLANTVSFEYGPAGSGTGAVKYTGEAICTSYEVSATVGDALTFSLELQVTGAITRGTY